MSVGKMSTIFITCCLIFLCYVGAKVQDPCECCEVQQLKDAMEEMRRYVANLESKVDRITDDLNIVKDSPFNTSPAPFSRHSVWGCIDDTITVACPDEQRINITKATYGRYEQTCNCCFPNPLDCTVSVREHSPENWLVLLLQCNNETSCSHTYRGEVISDCGTGYVGDYMHIFYDCLHSSNDNTAPIAFTAYATMDRYYYTGDIVQFDGVLSNFGNAYNPETSYFQCPVHGVYGFLIHVYCGWSVHIEVEIWLETTRILTVHDDNFQGGNNQASCQIMIECQVGELIWLRASESSEMFLAGAIPFQSHFSGFLVYRYE